MSTLVLQGEADQQLNALMNQNSVDSRTGWVLRRQNDDENLSIVPPIDATLVPAATSKQATFPGVWDTKFKELIQGLQKQFSDLRIQRRGNGYSLKVNRKVVAKLMPLNDSPPTFEVAFSSSISDAKASANALGPQAIEKTISNQPFHSAALPLDAATFRCVGVDLARFLEIAVQERRA